MTIGLCTLEFHLPACRSLKHKRMVLRGIRDRLGSRYNVAMAEVDYQDLWQRALIGIVSIASGREPLDRMFQRILREAERHPEAQLVSFEMEFL